MIARTLRDGARMAFHHLGGLRVLRWRNRRGLRILMYHRFADGDAPALERQCAHIRRYYTPLSMPRAVAMIEGGEPLPNNAVLLTVDDGHRDFLLHAWPVLRRYEIPATIYLISGFVDGELWPWFDRVLWMFGNTRLTSVEIPVAGRRLALDLCDAATRTSAGESVANLLPDMSPEAQAEILAELPDRLKVTVPPDAPAEYSSLSWDDVRSLAREQVDFGGHTVTHPILSRVRDERQLAWEITHSKTRIEHELGREIVSFCYPNGRPQDVSDAGIEAVKQAGYRVAVLAGGGLNYSCRDRFRLRRLPSDPNLPDLYFRQILAGFRTGDDSSESSDGSQPMIGMVC